MNCRCRDPNIGLQTRSRYYQTKNGNTLKIIILRIGHVYCTEFEEKLNVFKAEYRI